MFRYLPFGVVAAERHSVDRLAEATVIRRSASVLSANIVLHGVSLPTAVLMARVLGPELIGQYGAMLIWSGFWTAVGSLSIGSAAAYFAAGMKRSELQELVAGTLLTTVLLSALLYGVGYTLAPLIFDHYGGRVTVQARLFVLFVPLNLVSLGIMNIVVGRLKVTHFNLLRLIAPVATLVGVVAAFGFAHRTLDAAIEVFLLANALQLAVALAYAGHQGWLAFRISRPLLRAMLAFGGKAHLGLIGRTLNIYLDQLLISLLLPARALGLYAKAVSAASVLTVASGTVGYLAQPEIRTAEGPARGAVAARLIKLNLMLTLPATIGLLALMPQAILLVYGPAFTDAVLAARILCVAAFIEGLSQTCSGALLGYGRPIVTTVVQVLSLPLSIVLLLVLVPLIGIEGAAVTSVCAYSLTTVLFLVYMTKSLDLQVTSILPDVSDIAATLVLFKVTVEDIIDTLLYYLKSILLWLAFVTLFPIIGGSIAFAHINVDWIMLGLMVTFLACLTIGTAVWHIHKTGDVLSLITLAAAFYLFALSIGAVYYWIAPPLSMYGLFSKSDIVFAVVIAIVAWCFLVAGWIIAPFNTFVTVLPSLSSRVGMSTLMLRASPLLLIGWSARVYHIVHGQYFHTTAADYIITNGTTWIIGFATHIPTAVLSLAGATLFLANNHKRHSRSVIFFWFFLFVECLWYLPSGSREDIVALVMLGLILLYYGNSRQLPYRALLVGSALTVFVIFPFIQVYRGDNRHYQLNAESSLQTALHSFAWQSPKTLITNGISVTFSRFSDITSIVAIVHQGTPKAELGPQKVLLRSVETIIPKAWLSNKTDPGLYGNEFGRRYGFLYERDFVTSIAVSQPGELFLSYRWIGLGIGMVLVGMILSAVDASMKMRNTHVVALALYALTAWPLIQGMETTVAVGLFGLMRTTVLYAVILMYLGSAPSKASTFGRETEAALTNRSGRRSA